MTLVVEEPMVQATSSHERMSAIPVAVKGSSSHDRMGALPAAITRPSHAIKQAQMMRTPMPLSVEDSIPLPPPAANTVGDTPSGSISYTPAAQTQPGSQAARSTIKVILKPTLEVVRGERLGVSYPILEGKNIIGRTVNQPADIDLTGQERIEQVWTSRQHALISFDGRAMIVEDLKSLNGTFVNRVRLHPGQQRVLQPNDVIQVGTVQIRVLVVAEKIEG